MRYSVDIYEYIVGALVAHEHIVCVCSSSGEGGVEEKSHNIQIQFKKYMRGVKDVAA
jgi:hypothetical protein